MIQQLLAVLLVLGVGSSFKGCAPGDRDGKDLINKGGGGSGWVTVHGRILYEKITVKAENPTDPPGTAAIRSIVSPAPPVRYVDVVAIDPVTNAQIDRYKGRTDGLGNIEKLSVPATSRFRLCLRSSTENSSDLVNLEVRVPPPAPIPAPTPTALYLVPIPSSASDGAYMAPGSGSMSIDPYIHTVPSTTSTALYGLTHPSAVPNMIDALLNSSDQITLVNGGTPPPLVTLYWSPGVLPTTPPYLIDTTSTSFFHPSGGPDGLPAIYVMGGDSDSDYTDEFDDPVLHHEYGHFVAWYYSKDSSLGGSHTFIDHLYPSLSYSEGMATFLACVFEGTPAITRSHAITAASVDTSNQVIANLSVTRGTGAAHGIRSELSVAEILWALYTGNGISPALTFSQIFTVMASLKSSGYVSFVDFLTVLASQSPSIVDTTALTSLLATRRIAFNPIAPSDTFPEQLMRGTLNVTACTTRSLLGLDAGNPTGVDASNRFYQFTVNTTSSVTLSLSLLSSTGGGTLGARANGNKVDMILLKTDNQLLTDTSGTTLTPLPISDAGNQQVVGVTLSPATYVIYVCGRSDIDPDSRTDTRVNSSSNTVTYMLTRY